MSKRMLIDAMHPEETRVVVVDGNRLEEFDYESSSRRQLKGNIYLAKVIRVEPSLQAAFVDYGGNRHGFLPFGEIHPDYYQLPVADRRALIAEQAQAEESDGESDGGSDGETDAPEAENPEAEAGETEAADDSDDNAPPEGPELLGGDELDDVAATGHKSPRRYKIQEVIKRRQVLLIQVVKEERGTKGAALTTYMSLAGRYCVLMPNANRGGGISRKISNAADRKRVRTIMSELDLPEGVGVILRTAAMERSKAEIKRDYEYLLRLWENIRSATLEAHAPALIHEEGNLIKRSIRDLYSRDTEDILVEGEEGYRVAKDFMRMLIPSHAKRVQPYRDPSTPLLQRYQVETQLDAIHGERVELKSGGSLVINPTEALVAIDVNSGRSTRERNVENTAYRTNLEAAEEVPRQLRLRDLAGLIVIDFIDMEDGRNIRNVERKLKDALSHDRARIQVGRISAFGLLELSRQRLRPSLIEASMEICPHCKGMGHVRSIESTALHVLRAVEEEGMRRRSAEIGIHVPTLVALYVLNQKRDALAEIERRHGMRAFLHGDDGLIPPEYRIERLRAVSADPAAAPETVAEAEKDAPRGKRPRRRKDTRGEAAETVSETAEEVAEGTESEKPEAAGDEGTPRKRRRGRRGGRRRKRTDSGENGETPEPSSETAAEGETGGETPEPEEAAPSTSTEIEAPPVSDAEAPDIEEAPVPSEKGKRARGGRSRRPRKTAEAAQEAPAEPVAARREEPVAAETTIVPEPEVPSAPKVAVSEPAEPPMPVEMPDEAPALAAVEAEPTGPRRKGWWRRVTK